MLRLQTILFAGLLLSSNSCGSWSGNPPSSKVETGTTAPPVETAGTVEVVLQGTGTSLVKNAVSVTDKFGKDAGQIMLTSVQMQLASITLRKNLSDTVQRPVLTGPFQLDLLTNTITPTPDKLNLPAGDYQDLRVNLYKPASGSSIVLTGIYLAPNQAPSNVKIALDAQDEISFMKETATKFIAVTAGANTKIAVSFQLNQWFNFKGKDADLSAYVGKDLTIDSSTVSSDQALRQALLGNVKTATDFDKFDSSGDDKGKDKDKDHGPDGRGRR